MLQAKLKTVCKKLEPTFERDDFRMDYAIKNNIALECCPVSNFILGYTLDLRTHPVRFMLNQGVQATISADDPCFFNYSGLTLDYAIIVLAWEMRLPDLKKFAINGIMFSSVSDEVKEKMMERFHRDWAVFIQETLKDEE